MVFGHFGLLTIGIIIFGLYLRGRRQGFASDTYCKHKVVRGEPSDRPSICLEMMHFLQVACNHNI